MIGKKDTSERGKYQRALTRCMEKATPEQLERAWRYLSDLIYTQPDTGAAATGKSA